MARAVRQSIPKAPAAYDQQHAAQTAEAFNRYMGQREALGETIAGRLICTDAVRVPADQATTAGLPVGTLYLKELPGNPGVYFLTVVMDTDP
ncbi:MAG TPA: hypothetical protein VH157_06970 [Bryobacteraceae bacterium]|jgi:hypothetical protein|nr:hypothetical protein [Bryobacteraceae bacterium]